MQYPRRSRWPSRRPARHVARNALFSRVCVCAATKEIVRGRIVGTTEPLFRDEARGIFEIKRLPARRPATSERNLHTKCIYVYGMYVLVNMLFVKIPSLWSLRTRLSTIFRGAVGGDIPSLLHREYSTGGPDARRRAHAGYRRFFLLTRRADTLMATRVSQSSL